MFTVLLLVAVVFGFSRCGTRTKRVTLRPPIIAPENIPIDSSQELPSYHPLDYDEKPEMRAVWLTTIYGLDWPQQKGTTPSDFIRQRNELCNILNRLKSANFNTVFFQVRLRGDLLYPSKVEPQSTIFTGSKYATPNYDPLAFAIQECHKRGLALHAWIVTFPMGNRAQANSLGSSGIVARKPEWIVAHQGEYYLDPGLPGVRTHIASIAGELARRYDIDGVHFDYIRYPEGAESFNDRKSFKKLAAPKESRAVWREHNINRQLKEIADSVRKNNPSVLISAAPLGRFREMPGHKRSGWTCLESVHQNPKAWFAEGSVDFIVPMMYYRDELFDPYLRDWKVQMKGGVVIPGLGVYRTQDKSNWEPEVIDKQISLARHEGIPGICFYREENIRPGKRGIADIINRHFTMPIRPLPFPNRSDRIPDMPFFTACQIKGDELFLTWDVPPGSKAASYNIFFNIYDEQGNPGKDYLLFSSIRGNGQRIPLSIFSKKGKVHFRIEAANRANLTGRASDPLVIDLKQRLFL